jgi:hypothetical protein
VVIAIGSVGVVFIAGVVCAGICALGVLGVVGVVGFAGADALIMPELAGVLGVLAGFWPWAAAVGCVADGGVAGAPALPICAPSFGALPGSEPQAAKLMSSAASCGSRLRRE